MANALDEWDVVDASRRLLALVDAACDNWRFPTDANQALATAAMKRAADMIEEALWLATERGPSVGANVLVRAAFECWLVGVWALFGGEDALLGIEKERARQEANLARSIGLDNRTIEYLSEQQDSIAKLTQELLGTDAPSSVKLEQMARALPPYIRDQTPDHEDVDVLAVYDLFYRSHSTNDAHPWKPVGQYLREGGIGLRVERSAPWQNPVVSSALMAMYVGLLGRWIELARGGGGARWDDAVGDLEALLRPNEHLTDAPTR